MNTIARIFCAAAVCLLALPAAATSINLVQNPGFEAGSANWRTAAFTLAPDAMWAHSDPGMARSGCVGAGCLSTFGKGSYVSQLLDTTAGLHYDLSFWVRSFSGVGEFSVFWDGALIDDRINPNGPMAGYTYDVLASSNATVLEIHGRNDGSFIAFDDVVVTPHGPPAGMVPEPYAWLMLLGGLGLLAMTARRRR